MLNPLFGDFLVKNNKMSQSDLNGILPVPPKKDASVAVIAIILKVLAVTQVEELVQAIGNDEESFGDIAVKRGLLTDDRLDFLNTYRSNQFMVFIQILIERNIVSYAQIIPLIEEFQKFGTLSDNQFHALLNDDLEQIINIFVPLKNPYLKILTVLVMKTFRRLIDKDIYLDRAYVAKSVQLDRYAMQMVKGDISYKLYISGFNNNLLGIANYFTGATYSSMNSDALDNISEFINCINGQFATNVSYDDIDVDMCTPEYGMEGRYLDNAKFFVIPIHVHGYELRVIYEVNE